jgi:CRP-like cAMP-binding protein
MINKENELYKNSILSSLPSQLVSDYMSTGQFIEKSFNKNEIIHLEGDFCKQIELVLEGEIVVERIGESGDLMTVKDFHSNEIIGANLIFSSSQQYPMTITSKKPSKVIIIDKDTLFELCNQYPSFLLKFVQVISDLSVLISTKMKNRVGRTIKDSIITYLNKQYLLQQSYNIHLTMNKKALAERFGISRTSLSRELQKMKDEGLIDFDAKSITIINKNILR